MKIIAEGFGGHMCLEEVDAMCRIATDVAIIVDNGNYVTVVREEEHE